MPLGYRALTKIAEGGGVRGSTVWGQRVHNRVGGSARPRAAQRPDSGLEPRAELLAAAAELFTTLGYGATSTRAVAERAGMRQASMYHYVSGKEELLAQLLESTVTPSLAYAREVLADDTAPAEDRLWELCRGRGGALGAAQPRRPLSAA
ncbi:hypothetical protein SALBM311S_11171 [Streptomyces alboniger]